MLFLYYPSSLYYGCVITFSIIILILCASLFFFDKSYQGFFINFINLYKEPTCSFDLLISFSVVSTFTIIDSGLIY